MIEYITKVEDVESACSEIKEYLETVPKARLAVDTEGYSKYGVFPRPIKRADGDFEGHLSLIQVGLSPRHLDKQYIFDVRSVGTNYLSKALKPLLESSIVIGQALVFDWGMLYKHLNIFMRTMRDTMLISQVLRAGDKIGGNSLGELYDRYIPFKTFEAETQMSFDEYRLWKERMQKSDWSGVLSGDQLRYAAEDVRLIFFLYERLIGTGGEVDKFMDRSKNKGIIDIIKLECDLIPVFSIMELHGVKFDIQNHRDKTIKMLEVLLKEEEVEVGRHFKHLVEKKEYKEITGKNGKPRKVKIAQWMEEECINLNSPKQIKEALEPFTGRLQSTDKDHLIYHLDKHPAINNILGYKKAAKLLNTYGEGLIKEVHNDGRIHAKWYQIGSMDDSIETGRSACAKPNLMNQPRRGSIKEINIGKTMRAPYIADDGFVFIDADVSNMEMRLMAEVSGDERMVDAFCNDKDLHCETAKEILGLDKLPEDGSEEKDIGKETNLALMYGMGVTKYCHRIYLKSKKQWSMEEGNERRNKWFEVYSGVDKYLKSVKGRVEDAFEIHDTLLDFRNRRPIFYSFTMMGRPRRWYLSKEHELMCRDREETKKLHRYYEVEQANGRYGTFGNEFNSRLHAIYREAVNHPIQGTAADLIKIAQLDIFNKFIEAGFGEDERMIIVCHDEILAEVRKEHADEASTIIHDSMVTAGKIFIKKVPVIVKVNQGRSWGDCK